MNNFAKEQLESLMTTQKAITILTKVFSKGG